MNSALISVLASNLLTMTSSSGYRVDVLICVCPVVWQCILLSLPRASELAEGLGRGTGGQGGGGDCKVASGVTIWCLPWMKL